MSWNEREDDYASVAFWYQTGQPTFTARAPHARERKLPSLERVTAYARDFADATASRRRRGRPPSNSTSMTARNCSTSPRKPSGAWLEIPFEVKQKEPLRLLLNLTKAPDFGQYQVFLNGVKLGELYGLATAPRSSTRNSTCSTSGPSRAPTRCGWNAWARSPVSTGYYLGIESVRLRERRPRVAQYGFDKDNDWRKEPKLYN